VRRALAKVPFAAVAQDKRLYYEPGHAVRSRAWLSEIHLFQQLIYAESESFALNKEEAGELTAAELVVHYIVHLVRITMARNSFFMNIGMSRLLHDYTTAETTEIDGLIHEDGALPLSSYYRSRKALLMRELKERFRQRLRIEKRPSGDRFEPLDSGTRYVSLVRRCLDELTPWQTACWNDRQAGADDELEIDRMHAILHPPCYERLAACALLDDPDRRL
jgi:hypothetical protein